MAGPLLITGFGPFPGVPRNPTMVLATRLARDLRLKRQGVTTALRLLPTEYAAADALIPAMIAELRPRAVLMFGVAAKRRQVCIETRARNRLSILHPDAAGQRPHHPVLAPGQPLVLKGRARFAPLVNEVRRARLPARISLSAGGYLCNFAYWRMLAACDVPCVFIHIPAVRNAQRMTRLVDAGVRMALRLLRA